jgi:phage shock protein A
MYNGDKVREAFSRFDLLERRVDMAEGRADALGMAEDERKVLGQRSLDDEFAALADSDKVDEELEAMKRALKKEG